ncbi:MAG: hypothetical protein Q8L48_12910 [Archangium sp.]|nr:hypothetical protein [Archangium sp.]
MAPVRPERSRGVLALLLTLVSSPAFACAVCGAGENDPSRGSYVVMSVIISLLPLAMLGGIVGYVVVKTRASEKQAAAPRHQPPA